MDIDITSYLLGKSQGGGGGGTGVKLTVNPSTTDTTYTPEAGTYYNEVEALGVTSSIDANITASNIKNGVSILGVTGTYSGTVPTITNVDDLNTELNKVSKIFIDYAYSVLDGYTAYTNEALTIYTPDADCKHFMIQKKDYQYRIVWGLDNYAPYVVQFASSQIFDSVGISFDASNVYQVDFDNIKSYLFVTGSGSGYNTYYSNLFSTVDGLIDALKDSTGANINYTKFTGGRSFSGTIDTVWTSVITNVPIFNDDYKTLFTAGRVLSKNLTINVIS